MAILSNPAFGPRTALMYITGGLLLDVWTLAYYFAFVRPEGATSNTAWFWLLGLGVSGLVLILVGVFLGPIGQMARRMELPPADAMQAEATIQRTAAANPPPVVATGAGGVVGSPDAAHETTNPAAVPNGTNAVGGAGVQQPVTRVR